MLFYQTFGGMTTLIPGKIKDEKGFWKLVSSMQRHLILHLKFIGFLITFYSKD